jgi:hypothetical protein
LIHMSRHPQVAVNTRLNKRADFTVQNQGLEDGLRSIEGGSRGWANLNIFDRTLVQYSAGHSFA